MKNLPREAFPSVSSRFQSYTPRNCEQNRGMFVIKRESGESQIDGSHKAKGGATNNDLCSCDVLGIALVLELREKSFLLQGSATTQKFQQWIFQVL